MMLLSFGEIIFGALSLRDSEKQQMEYGKSLADSYMDRIHKELDNIDYALITMVVDGDEIEELNNIIPDDVSVENMVRKKKISDKILENFNSILAPYDSKYNLFFFDPDLEFYLTYGNGSYQFRENVKKIVQQKIREHKFSLTKRGELFPVEEVQGLFSVYQMNGCYIGAYISFEDFAKPLMDMNRFMCQSIKLTDQQGECIYEKTNGEKSYLKRFINKTVIQTYDFSDNGFSVQIALKNMVALYTQILKFIFGIMLVVGCVGAGVAFRYIRRRLILPVKQFQEEIKTGDILENYQGNTGIEEIDEAGKKIGVLSNENIRLQMKVYEEQVHRQEMELDYMSLKIRPHFFINCLNSMYVMAQLGRMEEIQRLSIYVSDYLRGILPSGMRFVRLDEELQLVDNYLEIQKIMRGTKFEYRIFGEEPYRDIKIPTLSIQTFVENSVKYATRDQGNLRIEVGIKACETTQGYVMITVEDNGEGFSDKILAQLQRGKLERDDNRKQVGIMNVMQRFDMLYENRAEIKFGNGEQGGARITILLPERREE